MKNNKESEKRLIKKIEKECKNLLIMAKRFTENEETAKELVQKTRIRIWEKRDKYDERGSFLNFCYKVMHNIFISDYCKVVKELTIIDDKLDWDDLGLYGHKNEEDPSILCERKEFSQILHREVDPKYIDLLKMVAEGYTHEEISAISGICVNTIKNRITEGRKKAKELWNKYYLFVFLLGVRIIQEGYVTHYDIQSNIYLTSCIYVLLRGI